MTADVGSTAPDFDLESDAGTRVRLADFEGEWLVLYFYPRDSTPGCTREAQDFTKAAPRLRKLGARVAGVSRDSVKSHCSFRDKFSLGFPLLSDPDLDAHRSYGAWGHKVMYGKHIEGTLRTTFLIAPNGRVAQVWRGVRVDGHADTVIDALTAAKDPTRTATPVKAKAPPAAKKKAKRPGRTRSQGPGQEDVESGQGQEGEGAEESPAFVTADVPATLVWIAPDPPDAAEARAIASWARAHSVALRAPGDERPPAIPVDIAVADEVEDLLDRARDATAAHDGDAIDRATRAAEDLLRAHPELPQASWLMAEVDRARSTRWRRVDPADPAAAEREWVRAEALDRGRMPGLGESGASSHPAEAQVTITGADDEEIRLDGETIPAGGAVATHAGPHALVVSAGGAPIWAGWIEVRPGSSTVAVDAPALAPCSRADAARAELAGETLRADRVRCARWVAVARGPAAGSLRVATCEGARCDALLVWSDVQPWTGPAARPGAPGRADHERHWPTWATWVLAGAGVAIAAGVAVAASGALQSAPAETRFVSGPIKAQ